MPAGGREPAPVTFAELATEMLSDAERDGFAPNTLRGYRAALRHHLLPRFGGQPVAELEAGDLAGLVGALRARGLTENGIVDVMKPLRKVLDLALRRGLIRQSPYDALEGEARPRARRDEQRILTPEEVGELAAAADEPTGIAIGLALFCGLRNAEARALRVRDLDLDAPAILVARAPAKGRRNPAAGARRPAAGRRVDGFGDAFGFLGALREAVFRNRLEPDDHLVRSPTGRHFDRGNFSRRYAGVLERAGLARPGERPLTFEQLRNNFAALGARIGVDPIELLRQLGKSHTASLQSHLPHFDRPPLTDAKRERLGAAARRLCAGAHSPGTTHQ